MDQLLFLSPLLRSSQILTLIPIHSSSRNLRTQHRRASMARGLMGVKADLSEFGRHLLDVACFLPPSIAADYNDSPPASPHYDPNPNPSSQRQLQQSRVVAAILRDLAEFGGSLRTGITKLSGVLTRKGAVSGGGVREEVLQFVKRDLVKSPESWLDFSLPLDDDFGMSGSQRDHIAMVEHLAPDLPTLRMSLCPMFMSENRFWKIYFVLLLPKLNEFEAEFLSTQLIVEEMSINLEKKMKNRLNPEPLNAVAESSSATSDKEIDTEQETRRRNLENKRQSRLNSGSQIVNSESHNLMAESSSSTATENAGGTAQGADQSQVRPISTEAATLQYFDRWSDTPVMMLSETDSYTETRQQISSKEDDSYSEAEDGDNVVLLKKYGMSPSVESVDQDYSLISFHERLRQSKKAYSGDRDRELQKPPSKELTVDEDGDWHGVADSSDYEIVERS